VDGGNIWDYGIRIGVIYGTWIYGKGKYLGLGHMDRGNIWDLDLWKG